MISKKALWITAVVAVALIVVASAIISVFVLIKRSSSEEPIDNLEETLVETKLGKINGSVFFTRLDKKFIGFRGVRYAEAPVDELRFQPPVPVKLWDGIFDATEEGPACPQPTDWVVSEDCLRLNVYTSEIPRDENTVLKPVFAWIHSGGLSGGSSISVAAGGEYLLDRDVVLVTINYRLASLGFISTGTKEAPGNNGFKDQSIALRWIRDNIEKFGGDPNSVTLMGQSAGARSVMLHLISPMSRGLFHRAIMMSGGVTGQWQVPTHQIHLARQQARILKCPDESVPEMFECLRKIDGLTIGGTSNEFKEFDGKPIVIWYPVVEPDFGQERFLTDDPAKLFASGNFSRVPIITGITQDEFVGAAPGIIDNAENLRMMNEDFNKYAPICFMYERDTPRSQEISRALWDNFINASAIDESAFNGLAYLYNDGIVGFTVHRFVQLAHKFTNVYYYKNTFVGRHSNFFYPEGSTKPYGVVHSDDVIYILKHWFPLINATDPEAHHLEQVLDMWVSFAITGSPNNKLPSSHVNDLNWTTYEKAKENYLDIGDELVMKNRLYLERYQVWESIFPMVYP